MCFSMAFITAFLSNLGIPRTFPLKILGQVQETPIEWALGIMIADVVGHGIAAALLSSMVSVVFTGNALKMDSPREVFTKTNADLVERLPPGRFATMFYAVYDASRRHLVFSSGG